MPFCPTCRTEHEYQFEQCPVCQAGLVNSLPDESDNSQDVQLKPLAQFFLRVESVHFLQVFCHKGVGKNDGPGGRGV